MEEKLVIWEVLKLIAENPKRKAACTGGIIRLAYGNLIWEGSEELFTLHYNATGKWNSLTDKQWTIIEPPKKLKEMLYGEAMYEIYQNNQTSYADLISTITGKDSARANERISKEEYLGTWTVTGVYEEDNTND